MVGNLTLTTPTEVKSEREKHAIEKIDSIALEVKEIA